MRFGSRTLFKDVSFQVKRGEVGNPVRLNFFFGTGCTIDDDGDRDDVRSGSASRFKSLDGRAAGG